MTGIQTIILAIIEGITEFLPISSTGHLVLASRLLAIDQTVFVKTFEVAIQASTMVAVIALYGKTLFREWQKVILAFIPTGVIGLLLYPLIKGYLIGNIGITIMALLIGGVVMIGMEYMFKKNPPTASISDLPLSKIFLIGVFQALSVIPGVSRSAATMVSGMGLGLSRVAAVEFSFLLAVPTLFAASGYDLMKTVGTLHQEELILLSLGFIVSFITALVTITWFLRYVKTNTLIPFGIYRIVIALLFLLIFT